MASDKLIYNYCVVTLTTINGTNYYTAHNYTSPVVIDFVDIGQKAVKDVCAQHNVQKECVCVVSVAAQTYIEGTNFTDL